MGLISGTNTAAGGLRSWWMDTNEALRQRIVRLVNFGISQKVIAARMDMAPSTLSKWLNRKKGSGPPSVTALDGFNKFVSQLREESLLDPTHLPAQEQERLEAETGAMETKHRIHQQERMAARPIKRKAKLKHMGKPFAKKSSRP